MKVAVTYKENEIFQHFGHSEQIKIYDVNDNKIVSENIIDLEGSGHGAIAEILSKNNVDVLICGGIGQGAKDALANAGIKLYGGTKGNADKAVKDFLDGNLVYDENVKCSHHEHQDDSHSCKSHKCGESKNGCNGNN